MRQFFEDNFGDLSMGRLMVFASFFPSTGVLLYIHTVGALSVYTAAYVLPLINGKWAENATASNTQNDRVCSAGVGTDSVSVESGQLATTGRPAKGRPERPRKRSF